MKVKLVHNNRMKILFAILNRHRPKMQEMLNELLRSKKVLEPLTTFHERHFMKSQMHMDRFLTKSEMERVSKEFLNSILKELNGSNVIRIKLFVNPYNTAMRAMVVYNEL